MNKYSKKKDLWNTTYNLQPGPICVVLGTAVLAVFYAIGAVVYHMSKFSILNWLFEEGYMGFLDNILTGFILVGFATIIIGAIWCIIIEPILKQFAIARYCRLPLTEEEIKLGVETGDFSSLPTYLTYLNKQMSYDICACLNFTKPEIKLAINNGINVFKPKDDEYFELPECICATLMECYDKENLGCLEGINDGMFLLHNKVAKMTEVPITVSSWGLYGKAYKEKADTYFKEKEA